MKPVRPIDPDDPFGSRPDEKPPFGWDERYWDSVRERIEIRRRSFMLLKRNQARRRNS